MSIVPFPKNKIDKLKLILSWLIGRIKNKNKLFVTEKYRPVKCSKYSSFNKDYSNDVAIMLQGPIIKRNNFTNETIKLYLSNFPNTKIVLSTWDSEKVDQDLTTNKNLIILKDSEYSGNRGFGSINYQIKGNKNGLKKICELGIKYSLKTRTDQRLGNPRMFFLLKEMIKLYPINKNINQNQRLIGMSFDTFVYRLYGLSDMFLFGKSEDVYSYFDCHYDSRDFSNYNVNYETQRKYSMENICEVYLMTEFLKKKGIKISWTLSQSLKIFKERFLVVDSYCLDFFWPKYSYVEDRWLRFDAKENQEEMTFSTWLQIYNSHFNVDENKLDLNL